MRACFPFAAKLKAKHYERRLARARKRRLALTPYDCGSHGHYAIPCYIVDCETGGKWNSDAVNPSSGAYGWYQLMSTWWPHGTPLTPMEQHRAAHALWAGGSGASNWSCA